VAHSFAILNPGSACGQSAGRIAFGDTLKNKTKADQSALTVGVFVMSVDKQSNNEKPPTTTQSWPPPWLKIVLIAFALACGAWVLAYPPNIQQSSIVVMLIGFISALAGIALPRATRE
jgi:H+/gluconate symporter-like permease